jgi:hypothetical protein
MTTTATTLIAECAADLFDAGYDRWTAAHWLSYLNSGERQLVFFKPTSYVDITSFVLVEGIAQSLPTGGIELIDVKRNMGTDGATPGASILKCDPKDLDETIPDWRDATAAATVVHFMFDPNNRNKFDVYPKQPSSSFGYVEAAYSKVPTEVPTVNANINLNDEYSEPLKNYMKFRAYGKDAQISEFSYRRSLDAYNLFVTQIGRKDLIEKKLPATRGKHGNSNNAVSQ